MSVVLDHFHGFQSLDGNSPRVTMPPTQRPKVTQASPRLSPHIAMTFFCGSYPGFVSSQGLRYSGGGVSPRQRNSHRAFFPWPRAGLLLSTAETKRGTHKTNFPRAQAHKVRKRPLSAVSARPLRSVVKTLRGVTKLFISTRSHEMCRSVNGTLSLSLRGPTL